MKRTDNYNANVALKAALRQIEAEANSTPLSDDFEVQVMRRVTSVPSRSISKRRWRGWRRVAALFVLAVALGGIVFAVARWVPRLSQPQGSACCDTVAIQKAGVEESDGAVLFDDLRLDSILEVVAKHYGEVVYFRNEEPRRLRLSTTWKMEEPLGAFVETLNEFDGLRLNEAQDTLFVTSVEEEDEE
ncbi:MAG: hypothetical protein IJR02_03280 [Bacteroidaceae bacterium]|nr:hypothetical protein [Bacteroidaceae bacterium]